MRRPFRMVVSPNSPRKQRSACALASVGTASHGRLEPLRPPGRVSPRTPASPPARATSATRSSTSSGVSSPSQPIPNTAGQHGQPASCCRRAPAAIITASQSGLARPGSVAVRERVAAHVDEHDQVAAQVARPPAQQPASQRRRAAVRVHQHACPRPGTRPCVPRRSARRWPRTRVRRPRREHARGELAHALDLVARPRPRGGVDRRAAPRSRRPPPARRRGRGGRPRPWPARPPRRRRRRCRARAAGGGGEESLGVGHRPRRAAAIDVARRGLEHAGLGDDRARRARPGSRRRRG